MKQKIIMRQKVIQLVCSVLDEKLEIRVKLLWKKIGKLG